MPLLRLILSDLHLGAGSGHGVPNVLEDFAHDERFSELLAHYQESSGDDYEIELIFKGDHPAGQATISAGSFTRKIDIPASQERGHTTTIRLPSGKMTLAANVVFGNKPQGPHQVILTRK